MKNISCDHNIIDYEVNKYCHCYNNITEYKETSKLIINFKLRYHVSTFIMQLELSKGDVVLCKSLTVGSSIVKLLCFEWS